MEKLFLFFGCSWTYGKNINLIGEPGDPYWDYHTKKQAELYSYRALITKHFAAKQINYSQVASSNDRQFRLASEHFIGPNALYNEINGNQFVLWFITSTARLELYNSEKKSWENTIIGQFDNQPNFYQTYLTTYYEHEKELEKLNQKMILWNNYFSSKGIKNIWVDTFNHHNYPVPIDNLLTFGTDFSDVMSNLCIQTGYTPNFNHDDFHYNKKTKSNTPSRVNHLVSKGLMNEKTYHPTQKGHAMIAEQLLIPRLEKLFIS
jgi:hypothetical protein